MISENYAENLLLTDLPNPLNNQISCNIKNLIVIAGPTGIGKTKLAVELSEFLGAEIFSADSRQIYREMSIGTAKPSPEELEMIRHHFINHKSIHETYNVGMYESEILDSLNKYFQVSKNALLVGGTGLYIRAVLEGLDQFPDIPKEVTEHYDTLLKEKGVGVLSQILIEKDPAYAQVVDHKNPQRLIRALSVIHHTDRRFSEFLSFEKKPREFKVITLVLHEERDTLYEKINVRVDQMIQAGLIEECRMLYEFKHLPALQTVGYQEIMNYFDGIWDKDTAIEKVKQHSRNYAKRQITWFKKYIPSHWILPTDIKGAKDLIRLSNDAD